MIEAVNVGSVLIPTRPVVVVVALYVAVWAAGRVASRLQLAGPRVRGVAEGAAWVGIVAARLGYVIANWGAFRGEPWTALYFWQPGYLPYVGVAAGAVYALWHLGRSPRVSPRRQLLALSSGYAAGAGALAVMVFALYAFAPSSLLGRGDVVPDFALVDLGGNQVRVSDLAGRGLILNFWATWCAPCRREMPILDEIQAELGPEGIAVIGINLEESPDVVSRFLARRGVSYRIWVDPAPLPSGFEGTRAIHQRFGGSGLPTTVFVGRDGTVRDIRVGELSRPFLLQRARAAVAR